jgi:hypothetical protein
MEEYLNNSKECLPKDKRVKGLKKQCISRREKSRRENSRRENSRREAATFDRFNTQCMSPQAVPGSEKSKQTLKAISPVSDLE